jgi:hypothetical protein
MSEFNSDAAFNPHLLLDITASDQTLHEQLWAFIREGHRGPTLIRMILNSNVEGIAQHTARLLTVLSTKILVESDEEGRHHLQY